MHWLKNRGGIALAGIVLAGLALGAGLSRQSVRAGDAPARFVGATACAGCHAGQAAAWRGSHHAKAMEKAGTGTVLGDFSRHGFARDGDTFIANAEDADGVARDHVVAYTFGVSPLQQYLVALSGGRLQALGTAWDSRPAGEGGQHWFNLYDPPPAPGDRLHWTGRDQTWNYQCADCHSTNLMRGYDVATDSYATSWTDVNVGCEACHGPGSRHIAWAQSPERDKLPNGLTTTLRPKDDGEWVRDAGAVTAHRSRPLVSGELDACAGCHSRRKAITAAANGGAAFLDSFAPALLEPGLYHADGQIEGEVYEYGSFLQSRMFHAGVTCSNCHDPHTLRRRAEGNALCGQCHLPAHFDVPAHHHHETGGAGAQCVSCHMPDKTFMVIDRRRDHSFRVPRPDLSVSIGTPNACTQCHTDKPDTWAASTVASWFPNGRSTTPHYATALDAGRRGVAVAEMRLDALIGDTSQPGIARASAMLLLPQYATAASAATLTTALADPDPLVRMAAARALSPGLPASLLRPGLALLRDPIRVVRIEAARALTGVDRETLSQSERDAFDTAFRELVAAELVDAERPETHLNLALLYARAGDATQAAQEFETSLRLDPGFVPALVSYADLERTRGMDEHGAILLRRATGLAPTSAEAQHALGLLLVRQHRVADAMPYLRKANELAPDDAHYAYVYAVALNQSGDWRAAMTVLEAAHQRSQADREVLTALILIARDHGDIATALRHARALQAIEPDGQELAPLIADLERRSR